MPSVAPINLEDVANIIQQWQKNGLTSEDKIAFSDAILRSTDLSDFQEKLTRVVGSVKQIDRTFNDIDQTFDTVAKIIYAIRYPDLIGYYLEWQKYKGNWKTHLVTSCAVAYDTIDVLERFDRVYLTKVENIQTEQDRLNAISALGEFIDGRQDRSEQMSRDFLNLKRDIVYFLDKFGTWLSAKGFFQNLIVVIIRTQIGATKLRIDDLSQKIREAKEGLAIAGSTLTFFYLKDPIASIILYILQAQLLESQQGLVALQNMLAGVESEPILVLKSRMDVWRPDMELMCQELVLFAEIWSSVRSQAIQFRAHILGGLDAATNMRFKTEVRLARSVCIPLMDGLRKYAADIGAYSKALPS